MNEFIPTETMQEMLVENEPLIVDIRSCTTALLGANQGLDFETHGNEGAFGNKPTPEDIQRENPDLDDEAAKAAVEAFTEKNMAVAAGRATLLSQVASRWQSDHYHAEMHDSGLSYDEFSGFYGPFRPTMPTGTFWEAVQITDEPGGMTVAIQENSLFYDSEETGKEETYATFTSIVVADAEIETSTNIFCLQGQPIGVVRQQRPAQDELLDRVRGYTASNPRARQIAESLIRGVCPDGSDEINAHLNEVWLAFINTSKEQEVGPLLEEVRLRYDSARKGQELTRQLGLDQPTMSELIELKSYLAGLLRA